MKLVVPEARTSEACLATVVADVLRSTGQAVEEVSAAGGEAREIAAVHEGMAEVGVSVADWVGWAYHAEAAYDGWRHTSLRALAIVWQPQWLGIAVRSQLPARTLREVADERAPLRLVSHPRSGYSAGWNYLVEQVFRGHGLELQDISARGGQIVDGVSHHSSTADDGGFDVLALPYGPQLGAVGRLWSEAQATTDLRFLLLDEDVLAQVGQRLGVLRQPLPSGGPLDAPADATSLYLPRFLVYGSERLDEGQAQGIVETLHDCRHRLLASGFFLDPLRSFATDVGLRFHRAALAYYREKGVAPIPQRSLPARPSGLRRRLLCRNG